MKIAVYTIAKNEEKFIQRWAQSAQEADLLLVADTGSTDSTIEIAKEAGCTIVSLTVSPWRFDDARNAALAYIPEDYDFCIAMDADEILLPGWRKALEDLEGQGTIRPRYKFVWSWEEDNREGVSYISDKIHSREGYRWIHPVHETLQYMGDTPERETYCKDIEIHHHPDESKPRQYYLPLLELAAKETPNSDRISHYLGREYMWNGKKEEAIQELQRHLSLPTATWKAERAASLRYIARCLQLHERESWLLKACAEAPGRRECWTELAEHYHNLRAWPLCYAAAHRGISITTRPEDYLSDPKAWGSHGYDMAAIAAWNMQLRSHAIAYGEAAVELNPSDKRLQDNLNFYRQ